MSLPSFDAVRHFTESAPFATFLEALCDELYMSRSRALSFFADVPCKKTTLDDRKKEITRLLESVYQRSNLPKEHPEYIALNWPTLPIHRQLSLGSPLASATFPVLVPTNIIAEKPVYTYHYPEDPLPDINLLAARLRERIPEHGYVQMTRVFSLPQKEPNILHQRTFPNFLSPVTSPTELCSEFANHTLDQYCEAAQSRRVQIDRTLLKQILGHERFLSSDNVILFLGEIRKQLPHNSQWRVVHDYGVLYANTETGFHFWPLIVASYVNDQHETVKAVFCGCMQPAWLWKILLRQEDSPVTIDFW